MTRQKSDQLIALVPAAGIGSRMQAECPKQYLKINGKTILEHSITALLAHSSIENVVVALHPEDSIFKTLAIANNPRVMTTVGGDTRAESVLAGLKIIAPDYDWVLVHDAARPCLQLTDLELLIETVLGSKSGGILATPASDTMKQAVIGEQRISHTIDREFLWRALTPQMFPRELLIVCLERALNEKAKITDEASALEYCGLHSLLIPGRTDNIKVTHPEDLALATFYLSN